MKVTWPHRHERLLLQLAAQADHLRGRQLAHVLRQRTAERRWIGSARIQAKITKHKVLIRRMFVAHDVLFKSVICCTTSESVI